MIKLRKNGLFIAFMIFVALVFMVSCKKEAKKDDKAKADTPEVKQEEKMEMPSAKEIGRAYGILLASDLKQSGLEIDVNALKKGFQEVMSAKEEDKEKTANAEMLIRNAFLVAGEKRAKQNMEAGEKFLAENAKKDGVITTESGLQYKVIKEGTGIVPTLDGSVKIHYIGKMIDGTEFDNSRKANPDGEPIVLGNLKRVIAGWQEALPLMKQGGIYELYIPYYLAYGEQGIRTQQGQELIPPYAALIFEIELIDVRLGEEAHQEPVKE
ncbi:MAG: peptidylprolyl isomerase [Treponema sp.]|nr:MAG: peptidylprolyl isomerase [Treponema sp.]